MCSFFIVAPLTNRVIARYKAIYLKFTKGQTLKTYQLFIDGEFRDAVSGEWFDDLDPTTGEVAAKVALGGAEDVDLAVQAAKRAFEGPWGQMST